MKIIASTDDPKKACRMVRHDFEPVFLRQDMQEVVTNSPKPIASDGLSSVTGPVVGRHDDNDGVFGHGTLTPEEVSQIQKLADEYNTQIDVIGSRAAVKWTPELGPGIGEVKV